MAVTENTLSRSLGPFTLWGLGVGYVISGMYFGWNLGLPEGGTLGLAIATFIIAIMCITFNLSYCELACAIPKAGGAFDYASVALDPVWGFLVGIAQIIEFVLAPPAIASAIGAYSSLFVPSVHPLLVALMAYFFFTAINIYGVKAAASLELIITVIAVLGILIFVGITLPHFHAKNLTLNAFPHSYLGILLAIPFAMWFFLGLEGVANVVEETINPQKNIIIGFSSAMITLVILCFLTFVSAVGVGGWEKIVFSLPGVIPSDSPLPLALKQVVNEKQQFFPVFISIGLVGLIASFNGFILVAGRATCELGRVGYAPKFLGVIYHKFKTPAYALLFNMFIGILALMTGKTAEIITLACFGALTLYIISMLALFSLRKKQPQLNRPFQVPLYPYTPLVAILIALGSLLVLIIFNFKSALLYFAILAFSLLWFKFLVQEKALTHEAQV